MSIAGYAVMLAPLGIAAIHTILTTFLTLGNEDEYYNFIIRRKKRRKLDGTVVIKEEENEADSEEKHGVIVIEIDGLLHKNGSSRANLFSGDTDNVLFTYNKMYDIRKFYNRTWYDIYSNPANFGRILLLCASDIIRELASQITHKMKTIKPRLKKNFIYLFLRACANVYIR